MNLTRRRLGIFLLVAPAIAACQLILDLKPVARGQDQATSPDASDPCLPSHALPPPPPTGADDAGPGPDPDYYFATRQIIVPVGEDAGFKPGLDLDDSCTCEHDVRDGAPSCIPPAGQTPACDFDGGVDDAFGRVAIAFGPILGDKDIASSINRKIDVGERTILIYLHGYNGTKDDPEVGATVVSSGGLFDPAGCGDPEPQPIPFADSDRASLVHPPRWDGCDRWSPNPGKFQKGGYPNRTTVVSTGYVSNWQLYVRQDDLVAEFLGASVTLRGLTGLATLTPQPGNKFTLQGILAARISASEAAEVVGRQAVSDEAGKFSLCDTLYRTEVLAQICGARDIMSLPGDDRTGKSCDGISLVLGFVAQTAQVSDDEYFRAQDDVECDAALECP